MTNKELHIRRSYRGQSTTFAHQHRGVARLSVGPVGSWGGVLIAVLLTGLWIASLRWVGRFWAELFVFWQNQLDLPGRVVMSTATWKGWLHVFVPYYDVAAAIPSSTLLWVTGIITAVMIGTSFLIPGTRMPLRYFIRLVAFIQATAVVFFWLAPDRFPYSLPDYMLGMMTASLFVISIAPAVLGLTHFMQDFPWYQKVGLGLCTLGYMTLFIPIKYVVQALILHHGSMLFTPLLYLLFGVPLDVYLFIALYAWGMSWKGDGGAAISLAASDEGGISPAHDYQRVA